MAAESTGSRPAGHETAHRVIGALAGPRPLLTKLGRSASHGVASRSPEAEYTSRDGSTTVPVLPAPELRSGCVTSERLFPDAQSIRKAVLPVAGLGTPFCRGTKAVPKEMLTVVDRPIVQHVVDEARAAGMEEFIFVTGRNKGVIEDYFDTSYELDDTLRRGGQAAEIEALKAERCPRAGDASFTRQHAPLGLGHAVWCARELVGREPFALLLPDVVTASGPRGEPHASPSA